MGPGQGHVKRTGFPAAVAELVLARSEGACEIMARCCTHTATDLHHRRPRGMGGSGRDDTNTAANALAACRACHMWVESNREWAIENGFLLGQRSSTDVPVWWRCARNKTGSKIMVYLREDGSKKHFGTGDISSFTW